MRYVATDEKISVGEVCSNVWILKNGKAPGALWVHWRNAEARW